MLFRALSLQLETIQVNRGLADAASLEASKPLVEVRPAHVHALPWVGLGWPTLCLLLWMPWPPECACHTTITLHVPQASPSTPCRLMLPGAKQAKEHSDSHVWADLPAALPCPALACVPNCPCRLQVLREAKEAKESAFQDQWKQMKQGKNRPLDEDELTFLDEVAEAEAARQRAAAQEEENELAAFHAAQQQRGAGGDAAAAAAAAENDGEDYWQGAGAGPQVQQAAAEVPAAAARAAKPAPAVAKKAPLVAIKPLIRPIVRVKGRGEQPPAPAAAAASSEPAAKRARTAAGGEQQAAEGSGSDGEPGLGGLLGGYGSGSDSD